MSDLERRLTAALHEDVLPARDAVFRVEVLVRLEQARFRRHVARVVAVAAAVAVVGAVNAPAVSAWIAADGQRFWIVAFAAAAASCVLPVVILMPGIRTIVNDALYRAS